MNGCVGNSVTIEICFIQLYNCSSNRLKVADKTLSQFLVVHGFSPILFFYEAERVTLKYPHDTFDY